MPAVTQNLDLIHFLQKHECELTLSKLQLEYSTLLDVGQDVLASVLPRCRGRLPRVVHGEPQDALLTGFTGGMRAPHIPPFIWTRLSPKFTFALAWTDKEADGQEASAVSAFCMSKY